MKRTMILITVAVMLAAFAAPVLAQTKECNDENKAAWYDTFLKNFKGDTAQQKVAYDAAKTYLTSCPADPADKVADYMQTKFVTPYEKMNALGALKKQLDDAIKQKNYADQVKFGKDVIAAEPDNSQVYIVMGLAGLGDAALLNESSDYAKKAITMIEAGKPFAPMYTTKDQPLAYLNYEIGKSILKNTPAEAIPYFLKAARFDSELKKNPQLYLDLAAAYNDGPRAKQSEDYKVYLGKPESPESKLALANINQIIDRQIDALARATALADAANKKTIMDALTEEYKGRNKSDAGLNELVAGILSKPVPDIPTPLTSLPTTPATSTPATNGAPAIGGGATGAAPASTTGSAKPVPSPTPANKKPR